MMETWPLMAPKDMFGWKENTAHTLPFTNNCKVPLYEESRRSKQHTERQKLAVTNSTRIDGPMANTATTILFEALQPGVQVYPKPLPVVESLLPGGSNKAMESQSLKETNKLHTLSRCPGFGFGNQINQTDPFFSDERLRVSHSSREGLTCFNPAQLDCRLFLNGVNTLTRLDTDPIYGIKSGQTHANSWRGSRPAAESFGTIPFSHVNQVERDDSVKNSLLLGQCIAHADEKLLAGASMHQILGAKTSHIDRWHVNEGKDGHTRISDKLSLPFGTNHANEEGGNTPFHCMLEQELGSSRGFHEEQVGTSASFNFQFGNVLSQNADGMESVKGKGHWPLCAGKMPGEVSVRSRWSFEGKNGGLCEATRTRISPHYLPTCQKIDRGEAGTGCMGKGRCSPFFGTENLTDLRLLEDDLVPYKASSYDMKSVYLGTANVEGVGGDGIDQAEVEQEKAMLPGGRHYFSKMDSIFRIREIERKQLRCSTLVERTPNVTHSIHTFPCVNLEDDTRKVNHNVDSTGSCSKTPRSMEAQTFGCRHRPYEDFAALASSSFGKKMQRVDDGGEFEDRGAMCCDGYVKQKMWLQRWRASRISKAEGISSLSRKRRIPVHNRASIASQNECELSSCYFEKFDFREEKRACCEERSGLQLEPGNQENGIVSHFMKRFFTPSAAAMAIMGMTARQVHARQPHKRGLFGVWASKKSSTKPVIAQVESCKDFLTTSNLKPEFGQPPPTSVDP